MAIALSLHCTLVAAFAPIYISADCRILELLLRWCFELCPAAVCTDQQRQTEEIESKTACTRHREFVCHLSVRQMLTLTHRPAHG